MTQLPTLFVSHGAPTLVVDDSPARQFLASLGRRLGKPKAILLLSAHFDAPTSTVTASLAPETIYDFQGFAEALYTMTYPAPGDPALARRVRDLMSAAGVTTYLDEDRGLDHGAWIPLSLMYPDADVPVVQLSISARRGPDYHFWLGEQLQPLRDTGVLIVGSGGATHNLSHALRASQDDPAPNWVLTFREWLAEAVTHDRREQLANYRNVAPDAIRNHPTEEHFLPLLCAMGATSPGEPRRRIHSSETFGALAMDVYLFGKQQNQF